MTAPPSGLEERTPSEGDVASLARQLAPALLEACDGKLSDLRWFRSDWQRGGAATAYARWRDDAGSRDVLVKLPVGPMEHRATLALSHLSDAPTPRVAAAGDELGGYDLAWLVLERLDGEPMAKAPTKKTLDALAQAAASFWALARDALGEPAPDAFERNGWQATLEAARTRLRDNAVPDAQRWNNEIKRVQRALPAVADRFDEARVAEASWRHGDLHPGNAMLRSEDSSWGEPGCVLIDLGEVRPGSWIEDAVGFERLYWGREEKLHGFKPVKALARARKSRGLPLQDDWRELADIRRALLAAAAPASLSRNGDPQHLAGALRTLEQACDRLGL
ncbi:MAG: aminoglycoside phosphotransferase family protein [Planctomycetota bacterium]|nr:MAG: aminoglycoside phosphotransferase family protein [Planctomycetota bacterium]